MMPFLPARRRVVSPFLSTKARTFVTIPKGSIIETSDNLDQPGLHSIMLGNEELLAFTRDIEERTEPIDQAADSSEEVKI